MNDMGMPVNGIHATGSFPASSNSLPLGSMLPADEQQQHMAFSNGDQQDYSFFPMWLSSLHRNQGGHDASSYDSLSQSDSRTDHNQHGHFDRAYSDVDTGSMGMETNYSLTMVDSASTAGLGSHIGSSYADSNGHVVPSSYLTTADHNSYDAGGRSPTEFPLANYSSVGTTMPTINAAHPPRCPCYCNILQRLSELKDNKSGLPNSGSDYIMELEMETRTQILAMMRCDICLFQRTRALLLVGVILESVVDLLEGLTVVGTAVGANGRVPRPLLDTREKSSSSSGSDMLYNTTPGSAFQPARYDMCEDEGRSFLHPLVRARLQELFGLSRQLHDHAQSCRAPATGFGAADTVMAELSMRICALMGRLDG